MSVNLDLDRFNEIIKEYSSNFENSPANTHQIVQFCKDRSYNYKYGEINPYFSIWRREQAKTTPNGNNKRNDDNADRDDGDKAIDWVSLWDEYEIKYKYAPRNAVHLWSFVKEEKFLMVKYKEARTAFDALMREKSVKSIEGHSRSETADKSSSSLLSTNSIISIETAENEQNKKVDLRLKITKFTPSDEIEEIKIKFLELLESFRLSILHDPASPLQLFNFINEDTKYKVRYGDVKKCYNYSIKHKWFKPMKRMKKHKTKKRKNNIINTSNHQNDDEGVQFILQVDHDKIEQERRREQEEKKEIIIHETMNDNAFDDVLVLYAKTYHNPPRNASQVMNFAKEEMHKIYKYKACRIAFNRWKKFRKSVMPQPTKQEEEEEITEPGRAQNKADEQDEESDDE
eukprot:446917_1